LKNFLSLTFIGFGTLVVACASSANDGATASAAIDQDDAGALSCPDQQKRCAEDFTFPAGSESSVELRGDYRPDAWGHGDAMTKSGNAWHVSVPVPYGKPVLYKFVVNGSTWTIDPAQPTQTDGGNTNNVHTATTCSSYTCDDPGTPPPGVFDWRDSVIYFAFVDRFLDGNPQNNCGPTPGVDRAGDYHGGDWLGVTKKINDGYFTDLGVNTLWITVPVKNADHAAGMGVGGDNHNYSSYHGYWPLDPTKREDCFGTAAELKGLVDAAHAKNMKVLFDYAMVHVHITSPVYAQHNDWFWPNSKDGHDCICGQGCSWDTDYQQCWFADYLPHWNYTNGSARDYSVNAAVQLVKETGVDGFRVDAIKHVDMSWLTQLRGNITTQVLSAESPQQRFYMVGETYDFANRPFIASFVDPATKLDGQFDFPLRHDLVRAVLMRQENMSDLAAFMASNEDFYGERAVMSTFVGNHDMGRIIHMAEDQPRWDDYDNCSKCSAWQNQPGLPSYRAPFERVANAFAVLLTNKGAPLIYYGDEIGMNGAGDPDNRHDMQFGGLTADQQFLHDRIKTLTGIRAAHPAFRRGYRTTINASSDTWVYSMATTNDIVYVAMNRGDVAAHVTGLPSGALTELVTNTDVAGPAFDVPPRQTRIFVAK
jgi:glycosidase